MLYIKQQVMRDNWIIVDTDDGKETVVSYRDIKYTIDLGIDIKGVIYNGKNKALTIHPYSPNVGAKTAKLSMLRGINLTVNDGVLTYASNKQCTENISIRLSDYCCEIADNAFHFENKDCNVTLIFDDNLIFSSKSLTNSYFCHSLYFDVTELTNEKGLTAIYRGTIRSYGSDFSNYRIIDKEFVRYNQWICIAVIEKAYPYERSYKNYFAYGFSPDAYDEFVYKKYKSFFKQMSRFPIEIYNETQYGIDRVKVMPSTKHESILADINIICDTSNIRFHNLKQLINYISVFGKHEDVKEIYYDLVKRYRKLYLEKYGKGR